MLTPAALYIHIPFCAVRCPYCDFNTYAGLDALFEPYVAALQEEIRRGAEQYAHPTIHTIFVGGGTPTVLPPRMLGVVLEACRTHFRVVEDAEVTSEANPGTVDQQHFAALRAMGVNRLSMGVQSFDEAELRWLGRIHSSQEAIEAFRAARRAGFDNINLDFMFGLPDQAPATWERTLAMATDLGSEHLSLYSLTVEDGTPLADSVRKGEVRAPDDDLAGDLYVAAWDRLSTSGYGHYEISNWAMASHECRHNLVYWRNEAYLGFGAGAHSYNGERRWWNVRPVRQYIQRIEGGKPAEAGGETIDRQLAMGETMMVGLRLIQEGVSAERFERRYGISLRSVYGKQIAALVGRGLLEDTGERLRLTPQGRLLGNQVFAEFLP